MKRLGWIPVVLVALSVALFVPKRCLAQSDGPGVVGYAMHGLWTGAEIGSAGGFLATGSRYQSGEWRKLAIGAGLGALAGVGMGLSLGALIGAGAGIAIGLLEGSDDSDKPARANSRAGLRFALLADERSVLPVPGVAARF